MCRIPTRAPRRIADVFSGQESMTPHLARRFPAAEIEAFELPQWSGRSVERLPERTGQVSRGWLPAGKNFDLICSNTCFRRCGACCLNSPSCSPGGRLAVQIPNDLYEPTRALARMIAADGPWARKLFPIAKTRPFNESMEGLYPLLSPILVSVDIWEATYLHIMSSVASIVELMETTTLAPCLRRSTRPIGASFSLATPMSSRKLIRRSLSNVLLRLRRLFVVAQAWGTAR